jgi:hypothetical protein
MNPATGMAKDNNVLEARVTQLEQEVADLKRKLAEVTEQPMTVNEAATVALSHHNVFSFFGVFEGLEDVFLYGRVRTEEREKAEEVTTTIN